ATLSHCLPSQASADFAAIQPAHGQSSSISSGSGFTRPHPRSERVMTVEKVPLQSGHGPSRPICLGFGPHAGETLAKSRASRSAFYSAVNLIDAIRYDPPHLVRRGLDLFEPAGW